MNAKGSFEISMQPEPPFDLVDGVSLSRVSFDKRFTGGIEGASKVQMLAARTPVENSAGYVAVERISGKLNGKAGSFVVLHTGLMNRGEPSLTLTIVPDSGTGELAGISGSMEIGIVEGKHFYGIEYSLPG